MEVNRAQDEDRSRTPTLTYCSLCRLKRWVQTANAYGGEQVVVPGARVHLWLFLLTTHTRSVFVQRYVEASFHLVQYAMWRRASTISFCILLCGGELPQSVFVYCYVEKSFHNQFLCLAMWMGVFTVSFVQCYV